MREVVGRRREGEEEVMNDMAMTLTKEGEGVRKREEFHVYPARVSTSSLLILIPNKYHSRPASSRAFCIEPAPFLRFGDLVTIDANPHIAFTHVRKRQNNKYLDKPQQRDSLLRTFRLRSRRTKHLVHTFKKIKKIIKMIKPDTHRT